MSDALHTQISDDLRAQIVDGALQEGDQIPSESELMRDYGVSRIVVRQAVDTLAGEGLVDKIKGRGTFVRPQSPPQRRIVGDFYGKRPTGSPFAASARSAGQTPEWGYESRETTASKAIADRLGIEPAAAVMRTRYTFYGDDEPVMLSTSYESLDLTRGTPIEQPEAGPIKGVVPRMDSIGKHITHVTEDVVARAPRPAERESLRIPDGTPVLAVERTYFVADEAVETADIVVSAHRYQLKYQVPVPPPEK